MAHKAFATTLKDLPMLTNLQIARRIVAGELAAKTGRTDAAVKALREGVAIEDALPYSEPPIWHHPVRQVLGAVLLDAGRAVEAEVAYREDLRRVRENGWSLFGLARALEAQGKTGEAAAVQARFAKAWSRADIRLTSSRVLDETPAAPAAPATPMSHPHGHAARSEEVPLGAFADLATNDTVRAFYAGEIAPLTDPIPAAFARQFQESTLARPLPPAQLETFVGESLKVPARVWQSLFRGFLEAPCPCRELGRRAVPTLLLWGDRDVYPSRDDQDALLRAIPGSRLIVYAGAGHALHWEEPGRTAADVVSFVYQRP
jgi:pimeloyl-ACP methyl ester carboxylesterase